jgi:hypothetical protein
MGSTLGIFGSASNRADVAIFSNETLAKFADACASIPIRPLDRAFDRAGIRAGVTNDDSGGARRIRFRQYLSTVDQRDARQLQQLGDALGALVDEAAVSKQTFLITAAEADGFELVNGAFRAAATAANAFAIAQLDDTAALEDRIRRLRVLARDRPAQAIAGARQLVESAASIAGDAYGVRGAGKAAKVVRETLQRLVDVVQRFDEIASAKSNADVMTADHARLVVNSTAAFVTFVAASTGRTLSKAGNKRRR